MKKAIFPVIGAVLFTIIMMNTNPNIEAIGIILAVAIGAGVGAIINKLVFRTKPTDEKTSE